LGAQKQFSLTAPDFDLRELPYFSRFSKWVELWKRVRFSPSVCLAVGYKSLVMKRQSFCKESFVFLPSVQASACEHPAYHQRRPLTEMPKPSSRELVSWNNLVSTISRSEDFAISREQKHKVSEET
jgi:hypothetical protein